MAPHISSPPSSPARSTSSSEASIQAINDTVDRPMKFSFYNVDVAVGTAAAAPSSESGLAHSVSLSEDDAILQSRADSPLEDVAPRVEGDNGETAQTAPVNNNGTPSEVEEEKEDSSVPMDEDEAASEVEEDTNDDDFATDTKNELDALIEEANHFDYEDVSSFTGSNETPSGEPSGESKSSSRDISNDTEPASNVFQFYQPEGEKSEQKDNVFQFYQATEEDLAQQGAARHVDKAGVETEEEEEKTVDLGYRFPSITRLSSTEIRNIENLNYLKLLQNTTSGTSLLKKYGFDSYVPSSSQERTVALIDAEKRKSEEEEKAKEGGEEVYSSTMKWNSFAKEVKDWNCGLAQKSFALGLKKDWVE